jgi:hypothetical protein
MQSNAPANATACTRDDGNLSGKIFHNSSPIVIDKWISLKRARRISSIIAEHLPHRKEWYQVLCKRWPWRRGRWSHRTVFDIANCNPMPTYLVARLVVIALIICLLILPRIL